MPKSQIKKTRLEKGLTQQQLADAIGVKQQHIQRWESGKFKPKTDKLVLIAKALNCEITDLI